MSRRYGGGQLVVWQQFARRPFLDLSAPTQKLPPGERVLAARFAVIGFVTAFVTATATSRRHARRTGRGIRGD